MIGNVSLRDTYGGKASRQDDDRSRLRTDLGERTTRLRSWSQQAALPSTNASKTTRKMEKVRSRFRSLQGITGSRRVELDQPRADAIVDDT
jgi:hypothetical protein